jgi:hypothetical protein
MEICEIMERTGVMDSKPQDIEFCPYHNTIWNPNPEELRYQLAYGICEKGNTLVACAVHPAYRSECYKSRCINLEK